MHGIVVGFLVLIILIVLKVSIIIVAPISAVIIALLSNLNVTEILNNYYLPGFAAFVQNYLFIFLLSSLLGKIMEASGDATAIGELIIDVLGHKYLPIGILFISAIMIYGGISGFVMIFTIYPIAKSVFEKAGLPKSLILATITGGCVIIGIPFPGSPQIHNLILMDYFNTSTTAGAIVGISGILVSTVFSIYYLLFRTKRLSGNKVNNLENIIFKKPDREKLRNFIWGLLPMLAVFIFLVILKKPPLISLLIGVIISLLKNIKKIDFLSVINKSISNAAVPLMFAASVMGFGEVVSKLPVFREYFQMIVNLSFNPYFLVGMITNIASGLTGSGVGGILLTLSTIGENITQLADPEKLHRIIVIASTGLDTLPHNSTYLAMLSFTGLKLKDTYFDYFIITLVVPLIALFVSILAAIYL